MPMTEEEIAARIAAKIAALRNSSRLVRTGVIDADRSSQYYRKQQSSLKDNIANIESIVQAGKEKVRQLQVNAADTAKKTPRPKLEPQHEDADDNSTMNFFTNSFKQLQDQMSVLTAENKAKDIIPSPANLMSGQAKLMQNINDMVTEKIKFLADSKKGKNALGVIESTTSTIGKIAKFWPKFSTEEKVHASIGTTALIIGTGILIATILNPALGIGMLLIAGACIAIGNKLCEQSLKNHAADPEATEILTSLNKHTGLTNRLIAETESTYKQHSTSKFLNRATERVHPAVDVPTHTPANPKPAHHDRTKK